MDDKAKNLPEEYLDSSGQYQARLRKAAAPIFWFMSASVVFMVACFYFQLFWLLLLAGIVLTIKYWKYRKSREGKEGICFFGVLVALTGLIAMIIQYSLANN